MLHGGDPFKAAVALIRFRTKQLLSGEQSCNVKNTRLGFFCVRAAKGANKGQQNTVTGCVGSSNDTTELISRRRAAIFCTIFQIYQYNGNSWDQI